MWQAIMSLLSLAGLLGKAWFIFQENLLGVNGRVNRDPRIFFFSLQSGTPLYVTFLISNLHWEEVEIICNLHVIIMIYIYFLVFMSLDLGPELGNCFVVANEAFLVTECELQQNAPGDIKLGRFLESDKCFIFPKSEMGSTSSKRLPNHVITCLLCNGLNYFLPQPCMMRSVSFERPVGRLISKPS